MLLRGGSQVNEFKSLLGKQIELDIPGKIPMIKGVLIDVGNDIFVVYNGEQFLYIPTFHIHLMKLAKHINPELNFIPDSPSPFENQNEEISYRKILMNARGVFLEVYITGNQSISGYITSIMTNYFIFYSPVFHTLIIPLHHLKYLIPYSPNATPYSLSQDHFPLIPTNMSLARSFDQQLKKLEGTLVVLDLGDNPHKIGVLKKVENSRVELITANEESVYLHIDHIKTVHLP